MVGLVGFNWDKLMVSWFELEKVDIFVVLVRKNAGFSGF